MKVGATPGKIGFGQSGSRIRREARVLAPKASARRATGVRAGLLGKDAGQCSRRGYGRRRCARGSTRFGGSRWSMCGPHGRRGKKLRRTGGLARKSHRANARRSELEDGGNAGGQRAGSRKGLASRRLRRGARARRGSHWWTVLLILEKAAWCVVAEGILACGDTTPSQDGGNAARDTERLAPQRLDSREPNRQTRAWVRAHTEQPSTRGARGERGDQAWQAWPNHAAAQARSCPDG